MPWGCTTRVPPSNPCKDCEHSTHCRKATKLLLPVLCEGRVFIKQRFLAELALQPMTAIELAEKCGSAPQYARNWTCRQHKLGVLKIIERKRHLTQMVAVYAVVPPRDGANEGNIYQNHETSGPSVRTAPGREDKNDML